MKLGTTDISAIKLGGTDISKAYLGNSVVYESGPDYSEPFYIEDISGSSNTVTIKKGSSSVYTLTIYKSTDKVNWTSMGSTSQSGITATVPANGKLYLRCSTNAWSAESNYYYNFIKCSSRFNVGGNIMSLLYGSSFTGEERTFPSSNTYVFRNMFYGATTLVSAEKLLLPATTLTNQCYFGLFQACSSLTTAPALPATTMAIGCYQSLFAGCTSLTTAPALPATTLALGCYQSLFTGCTSLTTAELPATTLANSAYMYMFTGCTSLTYIKVGFTAWPNMSSSSASNYKATYSWTRLTVNTTGTFVCPAALPQQFNASANNTIGTALSGYTNAIPYGWTVQTY